MQTWQTAFRALTISFVTTLTLSWIITLGTTTTTAAQVAVQSPPPPDARHEPSAKCWSDWSEAALVVRREALMPVERASKLASEKHPGAAIIKVTLCEEQGKYVYHLLLRERQGQLKSELLDAR